MIKDIIEIEKDKVKSITRKQLRTGIDTENGQHVVFNKRISEIDLQINDFIVGIKHGKETGLILENISKASKFIERKEVEFLPILLIMTGGFLLLISITPLFSLPFSLENHSVFILLAAIASFSLFVGIMITMQEKRYRRKIKAFRKKRNLSTSDELASSKDLKEKYFQIGTTDKEFSTLDELKSFLTSSIQKRQVEGWGKVGVASEALEIYCHYSNLNSEYADWLYENQQILFSLIRELDPPNALNCLVQFLNSLKLERCSILHFNSYLEGFKSSLHRSQSMFKDQLDWSKAVHCCVSMLLNYEKVLQVYQDHDSNTLWTGGMIGDTFDEMVKKFINSLNTEIEEQKLLIDSAEQALPEMDRFFWYLLNHTFDEFRTRCSKPTKRIEKEKQWLRLFVQTFNLIRIPLLRTDTSKCIKEEWTSIHEYYNCLDSLYHIETIRIGKIEKEIKESESFKKLTVGLSQFKDQDKLRFSQSDLDYVLKSFSTEKKMIPYKKLGFQWENVSSEDVKKFKNLMFLLIEEFGLDIEPFCDKILKIFNVKFLKASALKSHIYRERNKNR